MKGEPKIIDDFMNQLYHIADVYIPKIQRSRVNGRFGFIEVLAWEQGERLIREVDGMAVGSMKVLVRWAKYPKRLGQLKGSGQAGRRNEQFLKWKNRKEDVPLKPIAERMWRTKQQPARAKTYEFGQLKQSTKVVTVEEVQDNLDWLDRSLTCITDTPRDIESLSYMINNSLQEKVVVRDLGKFKFLLTLESKEAKERLKIEGVERLKQWFTSISDWVEYDVCQTRRIWLEIFGLPIQLWSEDNIRKIAEIWGDVVMVEEESLKFRSFASAKVIVDTLSLNPIEDEVIIQVKDKGFKVSVLEAKMEFTIFHTGPLDEKDQSRGGVHGGSSNNVHGSSKDGQTKDDSCNLNLNSISINHEGQPRDHHIGVMKSMGNEGINQEGYHDGLNVGRWEGAVEEPPLNITGNEAERVTAQAEGRRLSIESTSHSSSTKTKTAQLRGIDYSEEMGLFSRLGSDQLRLTQVAHIDNEVNQHETDSAFRGSEVSAPPGFVTRVNQAPLGFVGPTSPDASIDSAVKANRGSKAPLVGHRVTRSQMKKGKKQLARKPNKEVRTKSELEYVDGSPRGRKSIETTESMIKEAEKALEVGELLGIKVISHKANAIKRITDSLKSNRGTSSRRARH